MPGGVAGAQPTWLPPMPIGVERLLIKTTIQTRSMLQDGYKACLFTPSIFLTRVVVRLGYAVF